MIVTAALIKRPFYLPFELFGLVVAPVLLLRFSPILLFFRHGVMALLLVYVFWLIRQLQLPIQFKKPQPFRVLFRNSIGPSILLSLILVPLIFRFPELVYIEEIAKQNTHFPIWFPPLFYAVISVPLQEFLFRAFLMERLKIAIRNPALLILISATVFGFAHAVFKNPFFPLLTGLLGVWWGYLYLKNNCFWPGVFSHAILGSVALALAIYMH